MFEMDGQLLEVVSVEHIKLARAGAVIKAKLRNVLTGSIFEQSFRSGDKFKTVRIDKREATYLYSDGTHHHFMDTQTYDQVALTDSALGDALKYLKENTEITVLTYEGLPIGVELPTSVDLEVTRTDPGFKGDTATGGTKPATLETGATVQVPLFIEEGQVIRVDRREDKYLTRV